MTITTLHQSVVFSQVFIHIECFHGIMQNMYSWRMGIKFHFKRNYLMFYSKVNDISNAKSNVGDPKIFLSRTIGQI